MIVEGQAAKTKNQKFQAETDEEILGNEVEISGQEYENFEPPD